MRVKLRDFRSLIQEKMDNYAVERKRSQFSSKVKTDPDLTTTTTTTTTTTRRTWIEILLDIPIEDYRKEAIRRIIAPDLINIKKEAFNVIKNWLNSCDNVNPLNFNANVKIKYDLKAAARVGYHPMAFSDLKFENGEHISNRIRNDKFRGRTFD
jgi:hypothetical protein